MKKTNLFGIFSSTTIGFMRFCERKSIPTIPSIYWHEVLHLIWNFTKGSIWLSIILPNWTLNWLPSTFASCPNLNEFSYTCHIYLCGWYFLWFSAVCLSLCSYSSYFQAFSFHDQNAADHYRSLRQELNPKKESGDTSAPKVVDPKCPDAASADEKKDAGIRKQVDHVNEDNLSFHILLKTCRCHSMMRSSSQRGTKRQKLFEIRCTKSHKFSLTKIYFLIRCTKNVQIRFNQNNC